MRLYMVLTLLTVLTLIPSISSLGCGRIVQSTLSVNNGAAGALSNELVYDQTIPVNPQAYMNTFKLEVAMNGNTAPPKFRIAVFADSTANATANTKRVRMTIYAPSASTPADVTAAVTGSYDSSQLGLHVLRFTMNGATGTNNGGNGGNGGNSGSTQNNTASSSYALMNHGLVTASCVAMNAFSSIRSSITMLSCITISSLPYIVDAQPTRTENECTDNTAYTIVIQVAGASYIPSTTLPTGSIQCDYNNDRTYGKTECTWANQVTPTPEIQDFRWGNESNSYYGANFASVSRSTSRTEIWGEFIFRTYDKNITKLEYALGTTNSTINDIVDWSVSDLSLFTNGGSVSYATGIPNSATSVYGGWYMKQGFTLPFGDIYASFRLTTSDGVVQAIETFLKPLKIYTEAK